MKRRWESRYSSCEMMYLELDEDGTEAVLYLDHSKDRADHYAAADVLAGAMDNEVGAVFGRDVLQDLKDAIRAMGGDAPPL